MAVGGFSFSLLWVSDFRNLFQPEREGTFSKAAWHTVMKSLYSHLLNKQSLGAFYISSYIKKLGSEAGFILCRLPLCLIRLFIYLFVLQDISQSASPAVRRSEGFVFEVLVSQQLPGASSWSSSLLLLTTRNKEPFFRYFYFFFGGFSSNFK